MSEPSDLARAMKAVLFAAAEPLTPRHSRPCRDEDVRAALDLLASDYAGRGVAPVERGGRRYFETAPDLAHLLRRNRTELGRLSRTATETLAITAYHDPVSRAEIKAIRSVAVARGMLDVLMEAGWVRPAGRHEALGRLPTYATTPRLLTHFGLASRRHLPGLDDLKTAGLLDPIDLAPAEALEVEKPSSDA